MFALSKKLIFTGQYKKVNCTEPCPSGVDKLSVTVEIRII
jgi:hypothetical protein